MSPTQKQHVAQTVTGFFEHDRPVVIALMALCLVAMILIARRTKGCTAAADSRCGCVRDPRDAAHPGVADRMPGRQGRRVQQGA